MCEKLVSRSYTHNCACGSHKIVFGEARSDNEANITEIFKMCFTVESCEFCLEILYLHQLSSKTLFD